MSVHTEYNKKYCTPEKAVMAVKSGDWVEYNMGPNFPQLLDKALAARKDELNDIKIRGGLTLYPYIAVVEEDPKRETFTFNSWHFSAYERKLHDRNLCNYIPMTFRYQPIFYKKGFAKVDVAFLTGSKMDKDGNFRIGIANAATRAVLESADIVIMEENENYPRVMGIGNNHIINISEVDMVVAGEHRVLPDVVSKEANEDEIKIAEQILEMIESGAVLQLGIGGLPDIVGSMIAESDMKNFGCHTEMVCDAYVKLHKLGKLNNITKKVNKGKSIWTLAIGTELVYDWLNDNPDVWSFPVNYTNDPSLIAQNDNMICVNSAIAADLYGQVCAESAGTRNISGSGGQLDFLTGSFLSNGGKGFICMTSSYIDKKGEHKSRIIPTMRDGNIITDPRSQAYYLVTEQGIVNLAGASTWERAEKIISIAHPDFREDLIRDAEKQKIWRRSNK